MFLPSIPLPLFLLRMYSKYSFEKEYNFEIECMGHGYGPDDELLIWFNDWNEGQDDIIFVGFIDLDKLEMEYKQNIDGILDPERNRER